jgi:arsenate reductase
MADKDRKPRVLFLCTGNSCRSQMAEGLLRRMAGDRVDVYSAGLEPRPVHPMAVRVMDEIGIDISTQRSKSVTEYLGRKSFAWIIIVCGRAQKACPTVFPGIHRRLFWPFEDPAAFGGTEQESLDAFRRVRDRIRDRLEEWVQETPQLRANGD